MGVGAYSRLGAYSSWVLIRINMVYWYSCLIIVSFLAWNVLQSFIDGFSLL